MRIGIRGESDMEQDLVRRAVSITIAVEFDEWDIVCERCLRSLKESSLLSRQHTRTTHSAVSRLTILEGLRDVLRQCFAFIGSGRRKGFRLILIILNRNIFCVMLRTRY